MAEHVACVEPIETETNAWSHGHNNDESVYPYFKKETELFCLITLKSHNVAASVCPIYQWLCVPNCYNGY